MPRGGFQGAQPPDAALCGSPSLVCQGETSGGCALKPPGVAGLRARERVVKKILSFVVLAVLMLPGCITPTDLLVAASAPKSASGMTVFLAVDKSVLARLSGGNAEYVIYYGDQIAYPP